LPIEGAMNRLANAGDRHAVARFFGL
jgi:hypothetical protein